MKETRREHTVWFCLFKTLKQRQNQPMMLAVRTWVHWERGWCGRSWGISEIPIMNTFVSHKTLSYTLCKITALYRMVCLLSVCMFSSVQSLSHVWLFETPWIAAHQASLSITSSRSLIKLMPIESVMPSSHLILCRPLLLPPLISPPTQHQGLFQWVNSSHEVAKALEFQLQRQSFQWTPGTDL